MTVFVIFLNSIFQDVKQFDLLNMLSNSRTSHDLNRYKIKMKRSLDVIIEMLMALILFFE